MTRRLALTGALLALTALVSGAGSPRPVNFEGVINDFSPRSTMPMGPYLVSGPWSLQLHPHGKARFEASLTMVRSDLWFIETSGDPESQTSRNFHTHHVHVTEGEVSSVGNTIVVTGMAIVTSNGNLVFAGSSPVQIEISGGSAVTFSNIRLSFGGAAAGHFTSQPYDGVITAR